MDRKSFLKKACTVCVGLPVMSGLLSGCGSARFVSGNMGNDGIYVDTADFISDDKKGFRSYIIVRNDLLKFPICVYRFSDQLYSALWMECTHQGAELGVSGDYLHCPAHGSEFDKNGTVTGGPADKNLRTFPVTVDQQKLFIDLRKK